MKTRTENSLLNIGSNFVLQMVKTILSFITRTVFIYFLGKEALGLNGLYTNVLSMLSLAELGIGTAINYSLYEPIAKKNNSKISQLMVLYKKMYRIIGVVVLFLGIIIIPFLKFLISDINTIKNAYIIYILFLANSVFSYFISYKETLINADQKNYKLVKINIYFLIILNLLQILGVIIFKSFIVYLLLQIIIQFIQKIVTNIYITNQYSDIDFNTNEKLNNQDLKLIKKNIKAMIFHKIGDYCINGTDNLIISAFINVVTVGIYSNYLMIISMVTTFTTIFFSNLTSSLGNLIVTENEEKKYEVYKKLDFVGFIMYGFCSVVLINIFNPFITLWIGLDYCLSQYVVIAIVFSFYLSGMRKAPYSIKSASGLYDIDKYSPIIQSVINLVFSILLVKWFGLLGVIMGTIISSIAITSWQMPYIVYKYILKKSFREYVYNYFKNFIVLIIIVILTNYIGNIITINSIVLLIIYKMIISLFVYSIIIFTIYRKYDEMKYMLNLIKRIVKRR